jgi:hypothetical protein
LRTVNQCCFSALLAFARLFFSRLMALKLPNSPFQGANKAIFTVPLPGKQRQLAMPRWETAPVADLKAAQKYTGHCWLPADSEVFR